MMKPFIRLHSLSAFAAILAFAALSVGGLVAASTSTHLDVSQKGRQFNPISIDLARGDTITIVNDDGELLHHAYIESDAFSFDSGDQTPGSRTPIEFAVSGNFKVLCGIHPKMKLFVHVE